MKSLRITWLRSHSKSDSNKFRLVRFLENYQKYGDEYLKQKHKTAENILKASF